MHGRKRAEYKARLNDPKLASALATKATQWHAVTAELLKRHKSAATVTHSSTTDNHQNESTQPQEAYSVQETLKIIEKALLVNPDPLYLWSQRREYLLQDLETLFDIAAEFRLTQGALDRNPKAYGPWFHRKWTLQQQLHQQWQQVMLWQARHDHENNVNNNNNNRVSEQQQQLEDLLQHELALSVKFLSMDERNFHCWNYRRFVVALLWHSYNDISPMDGFRLDGSLETFLKSNAVTIIMGAQTGLIDLKRHQQLKEDSSNDVGGVGGGDSRSDQELDNVSAPTNMTERQKQLIMTEWAYTQYKIQENFSNGSAFHYRSKLLPLMVVIRCNNHDNNVISVEEQLLQEELELVKNAMFTEPDDQTAWWYMVFLLDWAASERQKFVKLAQILQTLNHDITELVQAEDDQTKWGLLGLHTVLDHMAQLAPEDEEETLTTEMNSILDKLQALDPDRANRYESMKT